MVYFMGVMVQCNGAHCLSLSNAIIRFLHQMSFMGVMVHCYGHTLSLSQSHGEYWAIHGVNRSFYGDVKLKPHGKTVST